MLKKSIAAAFAIALAMTATVASAQTAQCTIAAYADAAGTQSQMSPAIDQVGDTVHMYVVLFTEDTAAAASYQIDIPGLGTDVFVASRSFGPSGTGLVIDEATGTNVALTECIYGFFGVPILVTDYSLTPLLSWQGGSVVVSANTSQDPNFPVYVTCTNIIKPCNPGPDLAVSPVIPNEATSFSSIKSLYN